MAENPQSQQQQLIRAGYLRTKAVIGRARAGVPRVLGAFGIAGILLARLTIGISEVTRGRERAVQRAREMVPLASLVHSYLIAQRVISAATAREAATNLRSRDAALALTANTYDYNIAVTAAMAEAYLEVAQGDLAELDSARRGLIDALLTSDLERHSALARRAIGLGFDGDMDARRSTGAMGYATEGREIRSDGLP